MRQDSAVLFQAELGRRSQAGARLVAALLGLCLISAGCASSGHGRPWIHRIYIDGARQVKPRAIRGKLALQQASLIPFSPKHYLEHPYMVEVDRERIETYYRVRGFYSAKVTKAEVIPYKDGENPAVNIRYTVEEGEPSRIREVAVSGVDGLGEDAAWLKKRISRMDALKLGAVFEHLAYLIAKEDIQRLLQMRGYAFAKVDSTVDINRERHSADVNISIEPGKKVHIGQTIVEGLKTIEPAVVAKHAALVPGEKFRPDLLDGAQGKLYNLGLFTTVLVEPVPSQTDPQAADVRIRVSEGKFRELNLGVGFGIEPLRTELHTEANFTKRSFFGGLRRLDTSLRLGYAAVPAFWSDDLYRHGPVLSARVDFTQPDLLGRNSEFRASLVYDLGLEYAYQYHGPGLRVGFQRSLWRNHIKLALSYNFQFLDFFETERAILDDPGGAGPRYGYTDPYRLGYLQEQLVLDLRNRPIDASRGFFAGALFEQGGVYTGSAFNYQKFIPEARGYVPLGSRVVLAARLQFGQIFVQGELGSPITQRLYLGGPNSHRGFTYNRLSHQVCSARKILPPLPQPTTMPASMPMPKPEDVMSMKVLCTVDLEKEGLTEFRRLPIGGDQMLLAQLEMRINLFKLAGQWFSMAAFVDAGDVAAPAQGSCGDQGCTPLPYLGAIDLRRLHVAVGGGLRYRTVVGAIRFDLGVRLNRLDIVEDGFENPDPGQRIAYHISIGEAF